METQTPESTVGRKRKPEQFRKVSKSFTLSQQAMAALERMQAETGEDMSPIVDRAILEYAKREKRGAE